MYRDRNAEKYEEAEMQEEEKNEDSELFANNFESFLGGLAN